MHPVSHSRVQGHRVESVKLEGHRRVTPGFPSGPRGAGSLAQAALRLVPAARPSRRVSPSGLRLQQSICEGLWWERALQGLSEAGSLCTKEAPSACSLASCPLPGPGRSTQEPAVPPPPPRSRPRAGSMPTDRFSSFPPPPPIRVPVWVFTASTVCPSQGRTWASGKPVRT